MPATTLHFVCTGNIYRSRLAEAYCASKCLPELHVLSCGIAAGQSGDVPISPYARDLLIRYGLESYAARQWQRTTATLIGTSDLLVFMEPEHRSYCQDWIDPARQTIEVWGIEDVGPIAASQILAKVERTFAAIRQKADELLSSLAKPMYSKR